MNQIYHKTSLNAQGFSYTPNILENQGTLQGEQRSNPTGIGRSRTARQTGFSGKKNQSFPRNGRVMYLASRKAIHRAYVEVENRGRQAQPCQRVKEPESNRAVLDVK